MFSPRTSQTLGGAQVVASAVSLLSFSFLVHTLNMHLLAVILAAATLLAFSSQFPSHTTSSTNVTIEPPSIPASPAYWKEKHTIKELTQRDFAPELLKHLIKEKRFEGGRSRRVYDTGIAVETRIIWSSPGPIRTPTVDVWFWVKEQNSWIWKRGDGDYIMPEDWKILKSPTLLAADLAAQGRGPPANSPKPRREGVRWGKDNIRSIYPGRMAVEFKLHVDRVTSIPTLNVWVWLWRADKSQWIWIRGDGEYPMPQNWDVRKDPAKEASDWWAEP
jgi:hypothetical protein